MRYLRHINDSIEFDNDEDELESYLLKVSDINAAINVLKNDYMINVKSDIRDKTMRYTVTPGGGNSHHLMYLCNDVKKRLDAKGIRNSIMVCRQVRFVMKGRAVLAIDDGERSCCKIEDCDGTERDKIITSVKITVRI